MDISVSHLNNRMALQVPDELPLGLVFIVGQVRDLQAMPDGSRASFVLAERDHKLVCRLPCRVVEETLLKEGDRVRVSGRLAFDPHHAQYTLSARDLEVLPAQVQPAEVQAADLLPATANTAETREQNSTLVPPLTELPSWVKKLAPPEVQKDLGLGEESAVDAEVAEDIMSAAATGLRLREEKSGPHMPREMLEFLSSAIDSTEEIELTPEMIAQYLPAGTTRDTDLKQDGLGQRSIAPPANRQTPFSPQTRQVEKSLVAGQRQQAGNEDAIVLQEQPLPVARSTTTLRGDPWQLALLVILTLLLLSTVAAIFLVLYISM